MSSLFRGAPGGDDEDDCVPGWANVERADDHRFRFAHADVGGDTGALVINSGGNGAVRRDRATHLDRNPHPEVEPVHLHDLLSVATAYEFHLPDLELAE